MMDHAIALTEVQYLNLNFLLTIQACLKSDRAAAAYKFHLDRTCAARLASMSVSQLQVLAANMPHESLFKPVGNLAELLDAPPGLAMTLCTVGARPPVRPPGERAASQAAA
ncbi:flagellar transcriptional regulator FlhD [Pseudoduganella violacea]|uniref:Transcriptional regulator n=1 Tax=Pseudoduganella violacea TaxID=1715466 RepID=A0A7W5BFG7_9BURK|nr:flagellar transcriptional regulator FlhD [Pseudoduganella violacea]MBB3122191.1 hypothetical protein [Pseudoduganella violacea]